jgi:hypothetical protein
MRAPLVIIVFLALSALAFPGQALAQNGPADPQAAQAQGGAARPTVASEYSDAYEMRRKIHVYASLATLPLFATQL